MALIALGASRAAASTSCVASAGTATVTLNQSAPNELSQDATHSYTRFLVGSQPETFADSGSVGHDRLDSSVGNASPPLTINVSGAASGVVANDTAVAGPATFTFTSGGDNFTSFVGLAAGNTRFVASGAGGYDFTGNTASNSLDLTATPDTATATSTSPGLANRGASRT